MLAKAITIPFFFESDSSVVTTGSCVGSQTGSLNDLIATGQVLLIASLIVVLSISTPCATMLSMIAASAGVVSTTVVSFAL